MGKVRKKSKKVLKINSNFTISNSRSRSFLGYKYIQNNKTKEVSTPTAVKWKQNQ